MRQLADGTWQIVQISNMNDLIQEEEKATKEKLAEINKPIQDEIDKEIQIGKITLQVIPDIFSSTLNMRIPMIITSDKQISLIEGKLINKKDDTEVVSDVKLRHNGSDTQCIAFASYDLNPFISSELEIIKNKASQIDPEFKITKITYTDGSSLALKTEVE